VAVPAVAGTSIRQADTASALAPMSQGRETFAVSRPFLLQQRCRGDRGRTGLSISVPVGVDAEQFELSPGGPACCSSAAGATAEGQGSISVPVGRCRTVRAVSRRSGSRAGPRQAGRWISHQRDCRLCC